MEELALCITSIHRVVSSPQLFDNELIVGHRASHLCFRIEQPTTPPGFRIVGPRLASTSLRRLSYDSLPYLYRWFLNAGPTLIGSLSTLPIPIAPLSKLLEDTCSQCPTPRIHCAGFVPKLKTLPNPRGIEARPTSKPHELICHLPTHRTDG